jgi:hypothetical protein
MAVLGSSGASKAMPPEDNQHKGTHSILKLPIPALR